MFQMPTLDGAISKLYVSAYLPPMTSTQYLFSGRISGALSLSGRGDEGKNCWI
jgi:hypothetical protein